MFWGGLGCFGVVWGVSTDPSSLYIFERYLSFLYNGDQITLAYSRWGLTILL